MLLIANIGNSSTVVALYDHTTLVLKKRVATLRSRTPDDYTFLLHAFFESGNLARSTASGMIVCSVVPTAMDAMQCAGREYLNVDPIVVSHKLQLGLDVRYSSPERLGADRLANAVAAVDRCGSPAIVVDLGTATTVDAISPDGAFVGGAIAPGLEVSEAALIERTAQLPHVSFDAPAAYIGTDTVTSLQSGLIYGCAALIDGLVDGFRLELGHDAPVLATGGLAGVVTQHTRTVKQHDPNLTLDGLRLLYRLNRNDV